MKTKHGGMFIALKYGAVAMAGATASYMYLQQEHERALLLARGEAVDARATRLLGHMKPTGLAVDDGAMNLRAMDDYKRSLLQ